MARNFQHSYEVCKICKHVTLGEIICAIKEKMLKHLKI